MKYECQLRIATMLSCGTTQPGEGHRSGSSLAGAAYAASTLNTALVLSDSTKALMSQSPVCEMKEFHQCLPACLPAHRHNMTQMNRKPVARPKQGQTKIIVAWLYKMQFTLGNPCFLYSDESEGRVLLWSQPRVNLIVSTLTFSIHVTLDK